MIWKHLSMGMLWLGLFAATSVVFGGCGRATKLERTPVTVANNLPQDPIFDNPVVLPTISPSPSPSTSPVTPVIPVAPVPVAETPVNVYPNGFLEGLGFDRAQMLARGLGPLIVRPVGAVGGNKIYACIQLDRPAALGGGVLTPLSSQCGAAMNRTPAVEVFVAEQSPSTLYAHALRLCYSPGTRIYFTKLGGNPCNAIPGNSIQAWFPDAIEAAFLGYAGSIPGLQ